MTTVKEAWKIVVSYEIDGKVVSDNLIFIGTIQQAISFAHHWVGPSEPHRLTVNKTKVYTAE